MAAKERADLGRHISDKHALWSALVIPASLRAAVAGPARLIDFQAVIIIIIIIHH